MSGQKEYSVAQNVLCNINTTRFRFYQGIYGYAEESRKIEVPELIELGKAAGFSHNMCLDEIIGCFYANFLTKCRGEDGAYWITERALWDFKAYQEDARYKYCELPLTIDFKDKYIRLMTRPVDTMDLDTIAFMQGRKWSRNKSQVTLTKKVKGLAEITQELQAVAPLLCRRDRISGKSLEGILEECGRQRKYLKDYTANINHRGNYASRSFLEYKDYYEGLMARLKNPVDWGGQAFDFWEIKELDVPSAIPQSPVDFLEESLRDGMVRELSKREKEKHRKDYTLTGHGHTVITSYQSGFHNTRLSVILRPEEMKAGQYALAVGNNTLYSSQITSYLEQSFQEFDKGWFICHGLGLDGAAECILHLCRCFDGFDDQTIFDYLCKE